MADDTSSNFDPSNEPAADQLPEPGSIISSAPFNQPTDSGMDNTPELEPSHPAADSAAAVDAQELYDVGLAGATGATEPNPDNAVVDYSPEADQQRQD